MADTNRWKWRIWFWQDNHTLTPIIFDSFVLFYAAIDEAFSCCLRIRHTHHYQISDYANRIQSGPLLRVAI